MGNTHPHFFVCASVAQLEEEEEGGAIDGRREGQHHQHYIHPSTPQSPRLSLCIPTTAPVPIQAALFPPPTSLGHSLLFQNGGVASCRLKSGALCQNAPVVASDSVVGSSFMG